MKLSSYKLGEGSRPTVLLHGFMGQGKNLRTLAQKWSERDPSRVFLVPDLRGHGTSPAADEQTTLAVMARDVLETARAEGFSGPLDFVGHSQGGRVSLAALGAAPEEVGQVVLLDIGPGPIDSRKSESARVLDLLLLAPDSAKERRELRAFLLDRGLSPSLTDWLMMNVVHENGEYRWRIDRTSLGQLHVRLNSEDLWPVVEKFGGRIRCIRGARAHYVTDADKERLERAGCRVDTVQSGHYVHVEALDAILDLLTGAR
ncbi:MAG: alpha/beta fold hydrolase [Myxococcaceae bacterium]